MALISEEPVLARLLRELDLGLLPRDVRESFLKVVEEVGLTLRSREMWSTYIASIIVSTITTTIIARATGILKRGLK